MRLAIILALATTGSADFPYWLIGQGPGETCGGQDERTGQPFPDCRQGLICRETGPVSIPGAGNTCQYAQLGEVCYSGTMDRGDWFIFDCEEGLECRSSDPSEQFMMGTEHTCVHVAGPGETCGGWDERTEEPFPDCKQGLICRDAGLMSISGAGNTCQYAQLGEACGGVECEEGLRCRFTGSDWSESTCMQDVDRVGEGEECERDDYDPLSGNCQDGFVCDWEEEAESYICVDMMSVFIF